MQLVALHGMPTSPRLWERLRLPDDWSLNAPLVPGLGDEGTRDDWSLVSCADALRQHTDHADILVGHDMGGVIAAMLARPGQSLVLSGTALGMYWTMIRVTSWAPLHRFFYERHQGLRFLSRGCLPEHVHSLVDAFGDHGQDWGARMRIIASAMRPPMALALRLRSCGVRLAWGRKDPWYPSWIAQTMARTTGGRLHWLESGHFAPWEDPRGFSDVLTGEAFVS
ncbi:MAG: alpha/beta hydrolase [Myxococcota bacterium]|nr:alpha/beta hydrolase [Myxococcota bacterium]